MSMWWCNLFVLGFIIGVVSFVFGGDSTNGDHVLIFEIGVYNLFDLIDDDKRLLLHVLVVWYWLTMVQSK